jgi:hypothetical protein
MPIGNLSFAFLFCSEVCIDQSAESFNGSVQIVVIGSKRHNNAYTIAGITDILSSDVDAVTINCCVIPATNRSPLLRVFIS